MRILGVTMHSSCAFSRHVMNDMMKTMIAIVYKIYKSKIYKRFIVFARATCYEHGLDPAAAPYVVQHVAAFNAQLELVLGEVKQGHSAQIPSADIAAQPVHDDAASASNTALVFVL